MKGTQTQTIVVEKRQSVAGMVNSVMPKTDCNFAIVSFDISLSPPSLSLFLEVSKKRIAWGESMSLP